MLGSASCLKSQWLLWHVAVFHGQIKARLDHIMCLCYRSSAGVLCLNQSSICRGNVHTFPVFCLFIQKLNRTRASDMLVLLGCWHFSPFYPFFPLWTWGWTRERWFIMQPELKRKSTQKTIRKTLIAAAARLIQPAENMAFLISLKNKTWKTAVMKKKRPLKDQIWIEVCAVLIIQWIALQLFMIA